MAAPLYFQAEIDELLRMPKRVLVEAWEKAMKESTRRRRRSSTIEVSATIAVEPEDGRLGVSLEVELVQNLRTDAVALTLYASIHPRPLIPICRYDADDNFHENPPWFTPRTVGPGQFHRHIYSERCVRDLDDWDACAEPLDIDTSGSPRQQLDRIKDRFLRDLSIRFSDSDTRNRLFDFGN